MCLFSHTVCSHCFPSSSDEMKKYFGNKSTKLAVPARPPIKQMQGNTATDSMSTEEWTDEKHSLYLKSMEASFVNQLYDSKEMLGWSALNGDFSDPKLSMHALFNSATTSGQFKVLRGGSWQKINYERNNPQTNRTNDCHDLEANPWIQHFRSSTKHHGGVASPALEDSATSISQVVDLGRRKGISCASATASTLLHLCESNMVHQDFFCSDTEMSDQNFVDEEVEGEEQNNRSSTKRMKSSITDASANDQIVPVSKSSTSGDGGAAENIGSIAGPLEI